MNKYEVVNNVGHSGCLQCGDYGHDVAYWNNKHNQWIKTKKFVGVNVVVDSDAILNGNFRELNYFQKYGVENNLIFDSRHDAAKYNQKQDKHYYNKNGGKTKKQMKF